MCRSTISALAFGVAFVLSTPTFAQLDLGGALSDVVSTNNGGGLVDIDLGGSAGAGVSLGGANAGVDLSLGGNNGSILDAGVNLGNNAGVDLSIGGNNGSILDAGVNLGGNTGLDVGANVGLGSGGVGVGANVDLGNTLNVGADVGVNGGGIGVGADVNLAGLDVNADVNVGGGLGVDVNVGGLPGLGGLPSLGGDIDVNILGRDTGSDHDFPIIRGNADINYQGEIVVRRPNEQVVETIDNVVRNSSNSGVTGTNNGQQSQQAANTVRGGGGGNTASAVRARGCGSRDDNMGVDLVTGTQYGSNTVSGWSGMSNVRVVDLNFCAAVEQQVSSTLRNSGLSAWLQQAIAHHSGMRNALAQADVRPSQVIAIRNDGSTLWVFAH